MEPVIISVVMSVYNAEVYLDEAIESILNQTYKSFEFIIINDGSTDKSLDIIEKYADKDNRIVLINRENRGLPYSLNEGILLAKGKYIARMDADDISLPSRLEEQVSFMGNNPEIGVCGTAVLNLSTGSSWILSSTDKMLKSELLFSTVFAHPTVMMNKALLLENQLFYNETFLQSQDFELWIRLADYTKFANLKIPLLRYRILEDSITRQANRKIEERYKRIKSIFEKSLKKLGIQNSEEENRLHFNLSVNSRIEENNIEFSVLKKYFQKIIEGNKQKNIFDDTELLKVLGKKWLWNMYYKKEIKGFFSKYFFYGLWSMLSK
ncbi:MAG: Glycosyl transferase family 2 [uncultured Sulfurovum sp.]|uniref:Glycosyl transferase family 2 n=1 Tax=uncultured Sulfurovum sp. TaxID=269237 RepID=A0A6S6TDZ5_9BACT|nr:MAG: Glycosyl transferase family 2 [uncultured Sulfurovum sp.]